jgi:hypothetical protein
MNRTILAAILGFVLGCGALTNGQVTNRAGAQFPLTQWMPTMITGKTQTTDKISKNRYMGNVEIRTLGIVIRADEAIQDVLTGEIELRGMVRATLLPVKPIWHEPK